LRVCESLLDVVDGLLEVLTLKSLVLGVKPKAEVVGLDLDARRLEVVNDSSF
jgi:hypothetical protein